MAKSDRFTAFVFGLLATVAIVFFVMAMTGSAPVPGLVIGPVNVNPPLFSYDSLPSLPDTLDKYRALDSRVGKYASLPGFIFKPNVDMAARYDSDRWLWYAHADIPGCESCCYGFGPTVKKTMDEFEVHCSKENIAKQMAKPKPGYSSNYEADEKKNMSKYQKQLDGQLNVVK